MNPSSVSLRALDDSEYAEWRRTCIEAYAESLRTGYAKSVPESMDEARAAYAELLPQGLQTPQSWINRVVSADGEVVGYIWLAQVKDSPDLCWIFDIYIEPAMRSKGFGAAAIKLGEAHARSHGFRRLGLAVYVYNKEARALYDRLGFTEFQSSDVKVAMEKAL